MAKAIAIFSMPYKDLLPPLSTAEMEALRQRVSDEGGIHDPVLLTEDGAVLDGHNRLAIDPGTKTKRIPGSGKWSDTQRRAFVIRCNTGRRNLSPDQERQIEKISKSLALELKKEGKTQKQIASIFGVSQQRVSQWLSTTKTSPPSNGCELNRLDNRAKVNPSKKPEIAAAVQSGKPQAQVAADLGVSQQAVSKIVREETKKAEVKEQRAAAAKKRETNCGVLQGDFRIGGLAIEDDSIDLIFTDPPYDEDSASLYVDICKLAASKLVKGGWLCAYTGQAHLPAVMKAFSETPGLTYAWTFCVVHSGGDLRFRKFKLQNGWKPIVAAFKSPLQVDWEWFKDVVSGGKEKSEHPWQQAIDEATHFIERLCPKHGLVFDPCCGSGTTLAAAKSLERKWLGYEMNAEHAETARARIEEMKAA